MTSPATNPRTTEITAAAATLPVLEAMSPLNWPDTRMAASAPAISEGAIITVAGMILRRHSVSTSAMKPAITPNRMRPSYVIGPVRSSVVSVAGLAHQLHRFHPQSVPQPRGDRAEMWGRDDAAVTLALPAGFDDIDEQTRPCRHHANPIRQHRRLVERV